MSDDEIFRRLMAPFENGQVKTRSESGRNLSYITARTAMNRLDEVVGPSNWSNRFYEVCGCLACEITIVLPSGKTVSKSDGGGFKQMVTKSKGQVVNDDENTDKTGFSDAFKRACIMLGVGRYLYRDGVADLSGPEPEQPPAPAPAPRKTEERTFGQFVNDAIEHCNRTLRTEAHTAGVELVDAELAQPENLWRRLHAWAANQGLRPKSEIKAQRSHESREAILTELYGVHGKPMRKEIIRLVELDTANGRKRIAELRGKGEAYEPEEIMEEALSN